MFSLFFSHPGFWSGNLFLIAPFPDLCLLVPFYSCKSDDEHVQIQTVHNFPGELFDDAGFFVGNLFLLKIQNFPLCETR